MTGCSLGRPTENPRLARGIRSSSLLLREARTLHCPRIVTQLKPRPRISPPSDLSQIPRSTRHHGRQTNCWRTSRSRPHKAPKVAGARRLADLEGSNKLDAREDGTDRVGYRYFAETSSSTWESRWVSHNPPKQSKGPPLAAARPSCVEYRLGLTTIAGLGFAMGNVFWYG